MNKITIHTQIELMEVIQQIGFLPLLDSGIRGYSAEEMADEDCRYVVFPDGGWDWPLWKWKGPVVTEGNCVYGKFFAGKAGFISREWWRDFYNYRQSTHPRPEEGSIEEAYPADLGGTWQYDHTRVACRLWLYRTEDA